jgi:ABC-2 type transport system permease protein
VVLARRALRDARVRAIAFFCLFGLVAYVQPVGFRSAFPSLESRIAFARSFGHNKAVVLFYGKAYDLLTVGGYSAWRVGGTLAIFAAVFGMLASVRALRTEEDSGRAELVLSSIVERRRYLTASLAAVGATALALGCAETVGLLAGGLPAGNSLLLVLSTVSVLWVFIAVGAVISQVASTHRLALQLGGACVGLALLVRVIADTASGVGWLRWFTPLGWAEEQRPFTGEHPLVLLLPLAVGAVLLVLATRLAQRRDIGSGILASRERSAPRLLLLSSPTAQALRSELAGLATWVAGVAVFAMIIGVLAKSTASAGLSAQLQREFAKLGTGSITTPAGYIGLSFLLFELAVPLFAVAQVSALRREESGQALETLLALPVGRYRWLSGRLALAAGGAAAVALSAAVFGWIGVTASGASLSLPEMLEAGANCFAMAALFLGLAVLLFAIAPRAAAAGAYVLVTVSFLWQLFGSLLSLPRWALNLTPYAHLGLAPAQPFRPLPSLILVLIGLVSALAGVAAFRRRDLAEA